MFFILITVGIESATFALLMFFFSIDLPPQRNTSSVRCRKKR